VLRRRRQRLFTLRGTQLEKPRQPSAHRVGQFAVIERQPGRITAMHPPRLQQAPQPPGDEILATLERQIIVQHTIAERARHHVQAGATQVRDSDFQRIAINKQPRRIGKALVQQRPFADAPGA